MSEENTAETNGSRSFQERVFARFDSVDNRLSGMDLRIEKLEMKQYDTKPIWEQALAAILEVRDDVIGLKTGVAGLTTDVAGVKTDVSGLKTDMAGVKTDIADLKTDVTDLKTDVADLKTDVTDLKTDVADLKTDVTDLKTDVAGVKTEVEKLKSLESSVAELRTEMQTGFTALSNQMEDERRRVVRKLEIVSESWLELKSDQRYLDRRLGELEEQIKPT